jgi:hypothetical protein
MMICQFSLKKNIIGILMFSLVSSCGIYDNKYSQGIIDPINQRVFLYQGIASLTWVQTPPTDGNGLTIHSMSALNLGGEKIDSLHALAFAFSGTSRTFQDLVFISKINFEKPITAYPQSSSTIKMQEVAGINVTGEEVYLLKAYPIYATSNQGYYSGSYALYKNKILKNAKRAIGVIDYQGNSNMLLESDTVFSRINGTIATSGIYTYSITKADNNIFQQGSEIVNFSNSSLSLKIPVNNLSSADTLIINLSLVK